MIYNANLWNKSIYQIEFRKNNEQAIIIII